MYVGKHSRRKKSTEINKPTYILSTNVIYHGTRLTMKSFCQHLASTRTDCRVCPVLPVPVPQSMPKFLGTPHHLTEYQVPGSNIRYVKHSNVVYYVRPIISHSSCTRLDNVMPKKYRTYLLVLLTCLCCCTAVATYRTASTPKTSQVPIPQSTHTVPILLGTPRYLKSIMCYYYVVSGMLITRQHLTVRHAQRKYY